jgi:hypothetical protein
MFEVLYQWLRVIDNWQYFCLAVAIFISFYRWLKNVQANLEDPGIVESENETMVHKLKMYDLPAEIEWLR